jgi:hypothetical protein
MNASRRKLIPLALLVLVVLSALVLQIVPGTVRVCVVNDTKGTVDDVEVSAPGRKARASKLPPSNAVALDVSTTNEQGIKISYKTQSTVHTQVLGVYYWTQHYGLHYVAIREDGIWEGPLPAKSKFPALHGSPVCSGPLPALKFRKTK